MACAFPEPDISYTPWGGKGLAIRYMYKSGMTRDRASHRNEGRAYCTAGACSLSNFGKYQSIRKTTGRLLDCMCGALSFHSAVRVRYLE